MSIINGLSLGNLRGDLYGGVTAAVVALPLALAFGVASGAGPIAGLWGAILVGFFAALFGGTPSQISGPTGPMTVVMAGVGGKAGDLLDRLGVLELVTPDRRHATRRAALEHGAALARGGAVPALEPAHGTDPGN